jgi:hypothetical protein
VTTPAAPQAQATPKPWGRRVVIALIVIVGLVLAGFLGAAFIPRWWAQRIGDQVNGSIVGGVFLGLFYGFVFTALPLLVLWQGFRKRRPWRVWAAWVIGAVLLALPNLFTLGIVLGNGNAAHAGDRTLDVEAPGFRGGALAGAIAAVVALTLAQFLLLSRRRKEAEIRELKERLAGEAAAQPPPPSS